MKKTFWSLLLVVAMILSMAAPSLAAEEAVDMGETADEPAQIAEAEESAPTESAASAESAEAEPEELSDEPAAPEDGEEPSEPAPGEETSDGAEESSAPSEEEPAPEPEAVEVEETVPAEEMEQEVSAEAADAALELETDGATVLSKEKAVVKKIITDDMSEYDKLVAITKYAADNFSYSTNWTVSDFFSTGTGSCVASTQFIVDLCELVGINAWSRKSGLDKGAGSLHVCVMAVADGKYYLADAGYAGTKPRNYAVLEYPYGLSVRDGTMYQYDGVGVKHLVIPEKSPKAVYHRRSGTSTRAAMTITQIGYDGQECFNYSGKGEALKSITLPKTVKTVTGTAFKGCKNLENIYVDADNPYFTSIDGVLYSKDLTRLVCVPAKKTSISMPSTVKKQDKDAFYGGKIKVNTVSGTPFKDVSNQWFADSVYFVYSHSLFKGTSNTEFSPNDTMTRGMFITVLGRYANGGQAAAMEDWSGTMGVTKVAELYIRTSTTTEGTGNVIASVANAGDCVQVLSKVAKGDDGQVWYKIKYGTDTGYVRQKNSGSKGKTLLKVYTGKFKDLPSGAYYTGFSQWAYMDGIMTGVTDTTFCPDKNIKREDICVLLYRYLTNALGKKISDKGEAFGDDGNISSYARTAVYAMRSIGVVSGYPDNTFRPGNSATRAEVATMFQNLYKYLNG